MENCIFCKIVAGELPSTKVYEGDEVLAFLNINPRGPQHTLVIPKVHVPNILDLPDGGVAPFFAAVKQVDAILVKSLQPDGISIGINQGAASGQEVDHLHVHLIPRWHNDGGHAVQSIVHSVPKESLDTVAAKIRGVIE